MLDELLDSELSPTGGHSGVESNILCLYSEVYRKRTQEVMPEITCLTDRTQVVTI